MLQVTTTYYFPPWHTNDQGIRDNTDALQHVSGRIETDAELALAREYQAYPTFTTIGGSLLTFMALPQNIEHPLKKPMSRYDTVPEMGDVADWYARVPN